MRNALGIGNPFNINISFDSIKIKRIDQSNVNGVRLNPFNLTYPFFRFDSSLGIIALAPMIPNQI